MTVVRLGTAWLAAAMTTALAAATPAAAQDTPATGTPTPTPPTGTPTPASDPGATAAPDTPPAADAGDDNALPPPGTADALAQRNAALVTGTASEDEHTPAARVPGARRVMFTSNARYDDVRAVRTSRSTGGTRTYTCDTPCELQLPHGQYRLRFTHAGEEAQIHVGESPLLVEANRGSIGELVVGTMTLIGGSIVLAIALLTGEGTCFTTESDCDIVHGPFALGGAAFAMAAGLFLMFDSAGGIDVTAIDL